MTVDDLIRYLEDWAPPGAAWEKDNVGLQIGSGGEKLKNILLCLELDDKVLKEAQRNNCNFIFTHHPFIYNPLKKIDTGKDSRGILIRELIKNNINVYSAHTNLDFTKDGVSFELARVLKLRNIRFLENQDSNQFKIAVFIPEEKLEEVSAAIFDAGAGEIGEYGKCSFRLKGEGTFQGSGNTNPAIGKKGIFETISEVRFETIVNSWNLHRVISALLKSHPYEEPAYDIYPLKNKNTNYGFGAIGELDIEMSEKKFLIHVLKSLKINNFKFSDGKGKKIRKVAVCGGTGMEMLGFAISKGADAFITADIKYHQYHDAVSKLLLIDAGHYETEIFSLNAVERKINKFFNDELEDRIKVLKYSGSTNPVKFLKQ
jgi:dinuclear metal center YbgI/SA1388 family protein